MTWYSTANSPFGADMGAPPGGGFQVNVFLRVGDTVYRTYNTAGPRHRAAQPHLPADRPAALRAPGGVAGLARRLAAVAHLQPLGRLARHRRALRRHMTRGWACWKAAWERHISHSASAALRPVRGIGHRRRRFRRVQLLPASVLSGAEVGNGNMRGTALVVLLLGVPTLLTAMVGTARGSPRWLVVWLGTLGYVLYQAVLFCFGTPLNGLFLWLRRLSRARRVEHRGAVPGGRPARVRLPPVGRHAGLGRSQRSRSRSPR